MSSSGLPPLVGEITDGSVVWERLPDLDYELLGYFLSCHLIIEHYINEYLKVCHPDLDWDAARQTFSQKMALLSKFKVSDRYDCIPPIKHLNSLRNKLSHDIEFKIEPEVLRPLTQYLSKVGGGKIEIPTEPKGILEEFTGMTCALFAGCICMRAEITKSTRT